MILIGKDAGEKYCKCQIPTMTDIFKLIDSIRCSKMKYTTTPPSASKLSMMTLRQSLIVLLFIYPVQSIMAEQNILIIDDRSNGDLSATSGNAWRLVTDDVMGGVSRGQLTIDTIEHRPCLHMQGEVKLDNNGGFVQIALSLSDTVLKNITDYRGITLDVLGNDEAYNIHLRSDNLWFPWQSYRNTFQATTEWQTLRIPFRDFKPYRTDAALDISKLTRIGLVAIGREFNADLCVARVGFFR